MRYPPYPRYKPSGVEWLGDVPGHWEVKRLKTAATYWVSNVDKVPAEGEVPVRLCNYTDVYHYEYIGPKMELMESTASPDEIRRFGLQVGDVLITKDSEAWDDIGVPALVVETDTDLVCGYHLAIIRAAAHVLCGPFLFRALQSSAINQQFQVAASGVTRFGLPKSAIGDAWLPVPPPPEQRAIAGFLDAQTAKLDALVAKKRALIEKLKEKRTALISRVVTRGLPPEAARAAGLDPHPRLRPSGIEWLGDVPEHWEVRRIKNLAEVQQGVTKGRDLEGRETLDLPYLRVANVQDGYLDLSEISTIAILPGELRRFSLRTGDVLMNEGGDNDKLGRGTLWRGELDPCLHQNHVFSVRPRCIEVGPWIALWTQTAPAKAYLLLRGKQTTNLASISSTSIRELPIAVPPLPEQHAISDYLDRETANIDRMVEKVEAAIERLQEYRAALITAAVTGKIDVRAGDLCSTGADLSSPEE